jgi:Asp-tRNA(Asn)/Glu-tRNA(Gln) amidotransferase A subunit family amidase
VTHDHNIPQRLQFLVRVVRKECKHLATTDQRLFRQAFTADQAKLLETDPDLAERVEAFVGRFGRLQDTVGDKLLPLLLTALGERTAAVIDNLDRAERLGLIRSADDWMAMRNLRNQMVHEYVEDPVVLSNALQSGHAFVQALIDAAERMIAEIQQRGWV